MTGRENEGWENEGWENEGWENLGAPAGLCRSCRHALLRSTAVSAFLHCALSEADRRYRKYPPLPVLACDGWDPEERIARRSASDSSPSRPTSA